VAEKDQFFSFDEALRELRLKEEELKRLVSEGEIRAFREGDTMKLRRADVENLRAELSGGEVVDLGDVKEELVFEDDATMEEAGMATEAISDVETILDDEGVETFDDGGEISIEEVTDEPVEAFDEGEEAPLTAAPVVDEGPHEGAGMKLLMILTTLVLLLGVPLTISATRGEFSHSARLIAGLFPGK
jgi:hypothetical protein